MIMISDEDKLDGVSVNSKKYKFVLHKNLLISIFTRLKLSVNRDIYDIHKIKIRVVL